MKHAKLVSGLIMVLIIAVFGYMAYYIIQAVSSPLKTVEAVLYTAEETVSVNGYFLRDEVPVPAGEGRIQEIRVAEGEKVSKGEVLFVGYDNPESMQLRRELDDVDSRLARLYRAVEVGQSSDISKLDQSISEHLVNLIYGVSRPRAVDINRECEELKTAVLRRGIAYSKDGEEKARAAIESLLEEKSRISAQAGKGFVSVKAPMSGYFTSSVDGYEQQLGIEKAEILMVQDLKNIKSLKSAVPTDAFCGKLVTGFEWRYAAVVPYKYAKMLKEGTRITLRFTGDYIGEVKVRVLRVGEDENGECTVVFSGTTKMSELIGLRYQGADIVFSTYEGIRIPKQALRINENGETGVYCLIAMQAKFVKTEQIYELDQHYIVRYDPASKTGLRPGYEVIVSSKNLYDGKIVQ